MKETSAQNVRGFLLYEHSTGRHIFRVYGEADPVTKYKSFTDYSLLAEDIEIIILSSSVSLYEDEENLDKNKLSWASKIFKKVEERT